jgi:hypothetical protein
MVQEAITFAAMVFCMAETVTDFIYPYPNYLIWFSKHVRAF